MTDRVQISEKKSGGMNLDGPEGPENRLGLGGGVHLQPLLVASTTDSSFRDASAANDFGIRRARLFPHFLMRALLAILNLT